jgi:GTP cyclohydrolase II
VQHVSAVRVRPDRTRLSCSFHQQLKRQGDSSGRLYKERRIRFQEKSQAVAHPAISDHHVLGRPAAENVSYLAAKHGRAGHFIDREGILACSNKD